MEYNNLICYFFCGAGEYVVLVRWKNPCVRRHVDSTTVLLLATASSSSTTGLVYTRQERATASTGVLPVLPPCCYALVVC